MIELTKATPEDASIVAHLHIMGWRDGYSGLLPQSYLDSLALIGFGKPLNPIPNCLLLEFITIIPFHLRSISNEMIHCPESVGITAITCG